MLGKITTQSLSHFVEFQCELRKIAGNTGVMPLKGVMPQCHIAGDANEHGMWWCLLLGECWDVNQWLK